MTLSNDSCINNGLSTRLQTLGVRQLLGMRCGVEKESLRCLHDGTLALTPHPAALGRPLTHPCITTDFSESQLEFVTGVHAQTQDCLDELTRIHQFTYRSLRELGEEMLWVSSMPCGLPTDETIPLARFGTSNVGRFKSVYRMGLGHRYGRRMQTISGIHYNWSMPGLDNDAYLGLVRNFRRNAFLLLYLFGASPAVCSCFVKGRTDHGLQNLGAGTMGMRHGTSLRMGRLGYQSDAQATLAVNYNSLDAYAQSLHEALTQPWSPYESIGILNLGGEYNQLSTTLLQIENEFYGTIRPKRIARRSERALHALRERGVEYVEVRCMDLDPFEPVGINVQTMRFLNVFLLHCLLSDSPHETAQTIEEDKHNQHHMASHGREPGLRLERAGQSVLMEEWAADILAGCEKIAQHLDRLLGNTHYRDAVAAAQTGLRDARTLPSSRVLAEIEQQHGGNYSSYVLARSLQTRQRILDLPWTQQQQAHFEALAQQSIAQQTEIEAADRIPFEMARQRYLALGEV